MKKFELKAFKGLLAHPNPAFACCSMRDVSKKEVHIATIEQYADKPATRKMLKKIPNVPGADAAREFYTAHNGAFLYGLGQGSHTGLEIFSIAQWPKRTTSMVESWIDGEYEDEKMPYGRHDFIAFAHIHGAASHIHWVTKGPAAGQIFWWAWTMRPDKDDPPIAKDFSEFLQLVVEDPVRLMTQLIPYTWFETENPFIQWKPIRYISDYER